MSTHVNWTNQSVLDFAGAGNPISAIETSVRRTVLEAMDKGWGGPPFDPIKLAEILGIAVEARSDIPDARTVPLEKGRLKIEFNPLRPRARVRFSIAHEVVHSLFPDCGNRIRNRGGSHTQTSSDDWQLEVLCNLGAAEFLMPVGSFPDLQKSEMSIDKVLQMRKEFDVSIEALLIRLVKLSSTPCVAFCASRRSDGRRYHLDYAIASQGLAVGVRHGTIVPAESVINDVNAIGYTAKGVETWTGQPPMRVECVGLAPYPGSVVPRVVGLLVPVGDVAIRPAAITEVIGNALEPRGAGPKIIAHVVPDSSTAWGGGGFASALRKRYPEAWKEFRYQVHGAGLGISLGRSYRGQVADDTYVFHMVAQRGFGPSSTPRIRYAALETCLRQLKEWATETRASVHMPRIGSGQAGGDWRVIRELVAAEVADEYNPTTVYSLPER